ncbi:TonB-dependent receptor, partial [bacterium]|nr:TonB-dependent receptor [bacterium]
MFSSCNVSASGDLLDGDLGVFGAGRQYQSPHDVSSALTVLDGDTLRDLQHKSLMESLNFVPGFVSRRYAQFRSTVGYHKYSYGLQNNLQLLVDGQAEIFSAGEDFIDPLAFPFAIEDIDSVEIIRSPATSQWGTNAARGAINIKLKSPVDEEPGTRFYTMVGDQDTKKLHVRHVFDHQQPYVSLALGSTEDSGMDEVYVYPNAYNLPAPGDAPFDTSKQWNDLTDDTRTQYGNLKAIWEGMNYNLDVSLLMSDSNDTRRDDLVETRQYIQGYEPNKERESEFYLLSSKYEISLTDNHFLTYKLSGSYRDSSNELNDCRWSSFLYWPELYDVFEQGKEFG